VVDLRPAGDPARRFLRDARKLTVGAGVPGPVAARIIPGFCRLAVEAVLTDVVFRDQLGRGVPITDVEQTVADVNTTRGLAALAIWGDPERQADVMGWLNKELGAWAGTTFKECNKGAHGDSIASPETLVSDTERLVTRLAERLA
jgi:hypothetical protein